MKALLTSVALATILALTAACAGETAAPPQKAEAPTAKSAGGAVTAAARVIDRAAIDALNRMGEYLRSLQSFQLQANTSTDEVASDGQKLQFDGGVTYRVRRPDAFLIETRTDRRVRQFIYNGHTLTVFAPRRRFYTQITAPATIHEVVQQASDRYDLQLPLIDLFYWGTPDGDTASITSASVVGFARIDGVDTDQYAFRQPGVDWQVWIQRGDRPLPRKIVITTLDGVADPQFSAVLDWNVNAAFEPALFEFRPPAEAHLIRINTTDDETL